MDRFGNVRLITGRRVHPEKAIAICRCDAHRGYLTKELMVSHECLKKECSFFVKTDASYWKTKEILANKKKELRKQVKNDRKSVKKRDDYIKKRLEEIDGMKVTVIRDEKNSPLSICYICRKFIDLSSVISEIEKNIGRKIYLKSVKPNPNLSF